jgi:protein phosphatase
MISDPQNPAPANDVATAIYPPIVVAEDPDDMPTIVLPMQLSGLEDAAATDVGRQREHNEDYFGITLDLHKSELPFGSSVQAKALYIMCDGMGGHAGGEVASRLAVETLQTYFKQHWYGKGKLSLPAEAVIRSAILAANQAIYDQNQAGDRLGSGRMGTTLVMLLLCGTKVAFAHVGDSRLYRFSRKQGLQQLTTDHEVGQREIKRGASFEVAYARPDAYQLTQALGPRDSAYVDADIEYMDLNEDALFILASDGLTDGDLLEQYWPNYIESLLSSQANLELGVQQLVELGNQQNGHDNITAIVVRARVQPDLNPLNS